MLVRSVTATSLGFACRRVSHRSVPRHAFVLDDTFSED
jgi:hypothetical protein